VGARETTRERECLADARLVARPGREPSGAARERARRRGSRDARGREHDSARERKQRTGEAADVLVGHRAEHQHEGRSALQVRREGARAGRVVGAVEQDLRAPRQPLQPSGPLDATHGLRHALEPDRDSRAAGLLEQPDRDQQVLALVRAGQRHHVVVEVPRRAQVEGFVRPLVFAASRNEPCALSRLHHAGALGPRARQHGAPRLGGERAHDRRAPGAQHAGLLSRDLRERAAEVDLVVEIHAHDGRGRGLGDVRGVEPAAEPDLEHGDVDLLVAEVRQCGGRQHLEEGRVAAQHPPRHEPRRRVPHLVHGAREGGVGDRAAVHRDALVHPHEVRRGVAAGPQPRRPKRRVAVRRDRSLAVRPGDEQRRIRALGMAHLGHERAHRPEPELDPEADPLREISGDTMRGQGAHRPRA